MDELIVRYGWKKVAAVLVGVSALFLLYVIISFADIDKEANEVQKKKMQDNSSQTTIKDIDPQSQGGK